MRPCPGTDNRTDHIHKKRLLTIKEFCIRYGRSRSRAYELISSGELLAVKDGRSTLIPVDAAEAWAGGLNALTRRAVP
jgi:excisionase family DNA binding protein